jgi:hypothetical protein
MSTNKNTTAAASQISISVDGIWAGSGKLDGGQIVDCGAQFCRDADESEDIYEMIENAISGGRESVSVKHSDDDYVHHITWSIT